MKKIPILLSTLMLVLMAFNAYGAELAPLAQGIADYEDESYEEALENLKKARQEDPGSAEAAYYLGLTYGKLQDYPSASVELKEAVAMRPAHADSRFALAEALYNLNELGGASAELTEAEKLGAKPAEVFFLKGLILLRAGNNTGAVEAFEKAREADKNLTQAADYQMALAYVRANRIKEARDAFGRVMIKDPTTDLALYADEYSKALEKREERERPLKIYLGMRYEYDDNVVLKPGDSAVATGITDESDSREAISLRGEYTKRFSGPWSLRAQYSLYLAGQNNLKTHNIQSHTVSVAPSYNLDESTASLTLSYNNTLVHGSEYLQSFSAAPSYNFMLGPSSVASLTARVQKREFTQDPFTESEDRDSVETAAGAGVYHFFAGDEGLASLRYEINRDSTDGANWAYVGHKGSLSLLYPLSEKVKVQAYADAFLQLFGNTNTFFAKKRRDVVYSQSLFLSYGFYRTAEFVIQYTHVRNDSNIAIYDYSRNIISSGLEFQF